jgi:hypothetical protein
MMDRRQLFQILGAGVACGLPVWAAPGSRYLTDTEHDTVDRLCELLIPADASGAGAHDAGVAGYIDLTLQYGTPALRDAWRSGLAAVEAAAQADFGKGVAGCSVAQQGRLMDRMAAGENHPESDLEKFFVLLKGAAIQGFSLSGKGRQALGYRGDTAVHEFPGCTHPEHQQG